MTAVILAGGKGTRLKEVVNNVPKPMAGVAGKPFLEYLVMQLAKWNIRDIILSAGYKGEIVRSYFQDGRKWGLNISYSGEEKPLGTGGALKKATGLFNDEYFIGMNGDSFFNLNFRAIIEYHKKKSAGVTVGLVSVDNVNRYGSVEVSKDGEIAGFCEKGCLGPGLINGGVYVCNREIFTGLPEGVISLETDVLPKLIRKGLYGVEFKGFFTDIGLPQDYQNLCRNPGQLLKASGLK